MQLQDVVDKYFELLKGRLAEREMRLVAGALANVLPRGGITLVAKASNLSRPTIYDGIREIKMPADSRTEYRQRKAGAGRKSIMTKDSGVVSALRSLVSPYEHGDPESPLLWVSKSLRKLSAELKKLGHNIGHVTVGKILESMGFTLQSNKKSHEGGDCPDREAQFAFISNAAKSFFLDEQPVITWCRKYLYHAALAYRTCFSSKYRFTLAGCFCLLRRKLLTFLNSSSLVEGRRLRKALLFKS